MKLPVFYLRNVISGRRNEPDFEERLSTEDCVAAIGSIIVVLEVDVLYAWHTWHTV
jgi:hypothetical protein